MPPPLLLLATALIGQSPAEPLFPAKPLRALARLAPELIKLGQAGQAKVLREILVEAGLEKKDLERLDKAYTRARPARRPSASKRKSLRKKVQTLSSQLQASLAALDDPRRRTQAAELLLQIDHETRAAHEALGHKQGPRGWIRGGEEGFAKRQTEIQGKIRDARRLAVDLRTAASKHPVLLQVHPDGGTQVEFRGLRLHGSWPEAKLQRVLRNAVRAVAFSHWLIRGGELKIPSRFSQDVLLLEHNPAYLKALAWDTAQKTINPEDLPHAKKTSSYRRTNHQIVGYALAEDTALAAVYSYTDHIASGYLGGRIEHATFVAGHANWVLMALWGTALPAITYSEGGSVGGTVAGKLEEKDTWMMGAGLMGARSWLRQRVQAGLDPAWPRSFLPSVGQISGENLLKTTFVLEYLQLRGPLLPIFKKSSDGIGQPTAEVLRYIEQGIGAELGKFERAWQRWMAQGAGQGSILASLQTAPKAPGHTPGGEAARILAQIRRPAFKAGRVEDVPDVTLSAELSEGARLHAEYLTRHPEQTTKWPDAHEEYSDKEGFTAAGCWAGARSVIDPGHADPQQAIDSWMGTYYHRLPLLVPGLMQIGWGSADRIGVLDCTSVVRQIQTDWEVMWPYEGQSNVPLAFRPELPNPYPGQNQADWGYPITLQLGPGAGGVPKLAFSLHKGSAKGPEVPIQVSSPQEPGNPILVPAMTWCVIPKQHLSPGTRYHVQARVLNDPKAKGWGWSFKTGSRR